MPHANQPYNNLLGFVYYTVHRPWNTCDDKVSRNSLRKTKSQCRKCMKQKFKNAQFMYDYNQDVNTMLFYKNLKHCYW